MQDNAEFPIRANCDPLAVRAFVIGFGISIEKIGESYG